MEVKLAQAGRRLWAWDANPTSSNTHMHGRAPAALSLDSSRRAEGNLGAKAQSTSVPQRKSPTPNNLLPVGGFSVSNEARQIQSLCPQPSVVRLPPISLPPAITTMFSRALRVQRAAAPSLRAARAARAPAVGAFRTVTTDAASASLQQNVPEVCECAFFHHQRVIGLPASPKWPPATILR